MIHIIFLYGGRLRWFVSGENRHVNTNGCLTVHCKNEEIEDAVYALGIVFDLEYLSPRGGLCVNFALRSDKPTIIDDDKLRGIICGDLFSTPNMCHGEKVTTVDLGPIFGSGVQRRKVTPTSKAVQVVSVVARGDSDGDIDEDLWDG